MAFFKCLKIKSKMVDAVADYLGMDQDLVNGFVTAVQFEKASSDCYIMEKDEASGTVSMRFYVAGAWDLEEALADVYVDDGLLAKLKTEPLSENSTKSGGFVQTIRTARHNRAVWHTGAIRHTGFTDGCLFQRRGEYFVESGQN